LLIPEDIFSSTKTSISVNINVLVSSYCRVWIFTFYNTLQYFARQLREYRLFEPSFSTKPIIIIKISLSSWCSNENSWGMPRACRAHAYGRIFWLNRVRESPVEYIETECLPWSLRRKSSINFRRCSTGI